MFALGSSSYPNFCAFGLKIDNLLHEMGGSKFQEVTCGDEMAGQEQDFHDWAPAIFKIACQSFDIDVDSGSHHNFKNIPLTLDTVRFVKATDKDEKKPLDQLLGKYHNKDVKMCRVKRRPIRLFECEEGGDATVLVKIMTDGVSA